MSSSVPRFRVERLDKKHKRADFCCGEQSLDRYLAERANQDAKRHIAAVFVAVPEDSAEVAGYYTLSSASIQAGDLPAALQKKLPRYSHMPAILLGRLAVDQRFQGLELGKALLYSALKQCVASSTDVAAMAVIVDAINDQAKTFYLKFEFIEFEDHPGLLFLPMATVKKVI